MATIRITRNGKPVSGAEIEVISTFGLSRYYRSKTSNADGEAEFQDNENRFYVHVDGRRVETVDRLRGSVRIEL